MTSQSTDIDMPDDTGELALISRIPYFVGDDSKQKYLAYRSCGFTIDESCQLAGIRRKTLTDWRSRDKDFKEFEQTGLQALQSTASSDLLSLEFRRNMLMFLRKDARVIWQYLNEPEGLTSDEQDYVKLIRKHYAPNDLLALEKVLNPEKHETGITVRLVWGSGGDGPGIEIDEPVEGKFKELNSG